MGNVLGILEGLETLGLWIFIHEFYYVRLVLGTLFFPLTDGLDFLVVIRAISVSSSVFCSECADSNVFAYRHRYVGVVEKFV